MKHLVYFIHPPRPKVPIGHLAGPNGSPVFDTFVESEKPIADSGLE